jgi:transcriptional regulator with XRE-family HTH domain
LVALGVAVKGARLALGLTQDQLAEGAGLHPTYISDIERGRRNVGLLNLDRLAHALHTDLPRLLADAERHRHAA